MQERLDIEQENRVRVFGASQKLSKEKHILRQMMARRMDDHTSATYQSNLDPDRPVLVEQGWQEPSPDERQKHDMIQHLQVQVTVECGIYITVYFCYIF